MRPAAGAQLAAEQLDDAKADARLVGEMPETSTVGPVVANAAPRGDLARSSRRSATTPRTSRRRRGRLPKRDALGVQVRRSPQKHRARDSLVWRRLTIRRRQAAAPGCGKTRRRVLAGEMGTTTPRRSPPTAAYRLLVSSTNSAWARSSTSSLGPSRSTSSCASRVRTLRRCRRQPTASKTLTSHRSLCAISSYSTTSRRRTSRTSSSHCR